MYSSASVLFGLLAFMPNTFGSMPNYDIYYEKVKAAALRDPCVIKSQANGANNVDFERIFGKNEYYVSMGSYSMYRRYFEVLSDRPAQTEKEISSLKPRIYISNPYIGFLYIFTTGFDKPFELESKTTLHEYCDILNSNQLFCGGLPTNYVGSEFTSIIADTVVETDNETFVIMTRCMNGVADDWKLLTTSPLVSSELEDKVRKAAGRLGFNSENIVHMKFTPTLSD